MSKLMKMKSSISCGAPMTRVVVLIDADQFFQKKHMVRLRQFPERYEFHFFSASVYPSGSKKPTPKALVTFCTELNDCDRVAVHETTTDTTKDAADRCMLKTAAKLHAELPCNVEFLYVTNDKLLARSLGALLAARHAVHWHHLHLLGNSSIENCKSGEINGRQRKA